MRRFFLASAMFLLVSGTTVLPPAAWSATAKGGASLVERGERLARDLDDDGAEPTPGAQGDKRASIDRLAGFVPLLETHVQEHPRDVRALVTLARLRYLQIQFEAVGAKTAAPTIRAGETSLDHVLPLLETARSVDSTYAPAWFWTATFLSRMSFYRIEHRPESFEVRPPDAERAVAAVARAFELAPANKVYRSLYVKCLIATGRASDAVAVQGEGEGDALARAVEDWKLIPLPADAFEVGASGLLSLGAGPGQSEAESMARTKMVAIGLSAAALESHFASTWQGFRWNELDLNADSTDGFASMFARAMTDSTYGHRRLFIADLEWTQEPDGKRGLALPWGTDPFSSSTSSSGVSLLAIECRAVPESLRTGEWARMKADPYCVLWMRNRSGWKR